MLASSWLSTNEVAKALAGPVDKDKQNVRFIKDKLFRFDLHPLLSCRLRCGPSKNSLLMQREKVCQGIESF